LTLGDGKLQHTLARLIEGSLSNLTTLLINKLQYECIILEHMLALRAPCEIMHDEIVE
jgi:hypothetical protein